MIFAHGPRRLSRESACAGLLPERDTSPRSRGALERRPNGLREAGDRPTRAEMSASCFLCLVFLFGKSVVLDVVIWVALQFLALSTPFFSMPTLNRLTPMDQVSSNGSPSCNSP